MRHEYPVRHLIRWMCLLVLAFPFAGGAWAAPKYKILHAFTGGSDGGGIWDSVLFDAYGNLYGTTSGGGAYGYGTAFELSPGTKGWTETVLYSFCAQPHCDDGAIPAASLIFDGSGNLYGTTSTVGTGSPQIGTIFELSASAGGNWSLTTLYDFCSLPNCSDGGSPRSGMLLDTAGNLYGTTPYGGPGYGGGVLFEFTAPSSGGVYSSLYDFCWLSGCDDGAGPYGVLIRDAKGDLYGTTAGGGTNGGGTAFELAQTSGTWTEQVLHDFPSFNNDGRQITAGLIIDRARSLYGVANIGGPNTCGEGGCGMIFKLTPTGNGVWKETVLHNFANDNKGSYPSSSLVSIRREISTARPEAARMAMAWCTS